MRTTRSLRILPAVLLVAISLSCSKSPVAPTSDAALNIATGTALTAGFGSGTFYPLAVGNTWDYQATTRMTFVYPDGTPAGDPAEIDATDHHVIVGTEERDGRTYFVREETITEDTEPFTSWTRVRQDRTGLFGADVNVDVAPVGERSASAATGHDAPDLSNLRSRGFSDATIARLASRIQTLREALRGAAQPVAARSAAQGEIIFLLYPLHPGLAWNVRPDFPFPAVVDGIERLDTPAGPMSAYRIDVDPFGDTKAEGDFARLWYGRAGFLGYSVHATTVVTDENGNPTDVKAIIDETRLLSGTTALSLKSGA